ncbi:MAG: hypothetical protein M1837_004929 [Sclerophora amabilis]|nr:MAG: hypothetical protein M1837_004929 [Sclerophora amabilis]
MLGTSNFEYVLIRTSITLIRAVTPLSICYCIARPFLTYLPRLRFLPILDVWAASETIFYVLVYRPWRYRLQRRAAHPPLVPREERRTLFRRCQENIPDPERYLSKWFLQAPVAEIKRENLKEFYRWAFLNTGECYAVDDDELEEYVASFEAVLGRRLEPGRGKAECLRLSLDKVKMVHRPLIWFLTVFAVDNYTHFHLLYHKFQYHRTKLRPYPTVFPFRPQTLLTTRRSPVPDLSYWYRPHKSKTSLPVVFLHGIGIGLYPYVPFLAGLNGGSKSSADDDGDVGIIAIEILPVSFRMTGPALGRHEMCQQIQTILLRHGFEKFVLVPHSYGSVITTHLLKDPEISPQIASVILIDPVTILLHLPDVAYNFTCRNPGQANEWQLWYFASTDMCVAHTLFRCFFWSENILWLEDFQDRKISVFLSGRDLIVNSEQVGRYLTKGRADGARADEQSESDERSSWKTEPKGWTAPPTGIKVFWGEELDHAQIFDSKSRRDILIGEVHEHSEQGRISVDI